MTDIPRRIIHDAEAWQEGYAAGQRGLSRKSNPYPPGPRAHAWLAGFIDGKATLP
jgi:ribosome modulation factor